VTDVFVLDTIAEVLNTPLHFLNYLTLRARYDGKIIVNLEQATLGLHLKQGLSINETIGSISLDDEISADLDIAMRARRTGVAGKATPEGILTRFDDLVIGSILNQIEKTASPKLTNLGLLLLQIGEATAKDLSYHLQRVMNNSYPDGKMHDVSIGIDSAKSGLTVHCNYLPEETARKNLSGHCAARKYDSKANTWYGILLNPYSGKIRAAISLEAEWKQDPEMDAVMTNWPRQRPVPISQLNSTRRKPGRNDACPCGSGKKYKKCCIA